MGDYYQALSDRRSEQYKTVLQQAMSVKDIDWDVFAHRIECYPAEACEVDSFGITPLHHVLRKYPDHSSTPKLLSTVRRLIRANPSSLQNIDTMTGFNALHIACSSRENSKDIVNVLLEAYPDAAYHRSHKDGRMALHRARSEQIARRLIDIYPQALEVKSKMNMMIPLHDACSDNKVPPDVVQLLIEEGKRNKIGQVIKRPCSLSSSSMYCGGLLVDDANGEKPIKHLFNRIQYGSNSVDSLNEDSPLWRKLCIVVRATYEALLQHHEDIPATSIPLVHAIIECGGNPHVVKKALGFHPDQINMRDIRGRTPLSIAAAKVNTHPEMFKLLLAEEYGGRDAATMKDHDQNLPLHLALKNGRTLSNGVNLLAEVAPESIALRDRDTDMYSFMIAAIPKYRWDNTCLNTIYSLLHMAPYVIKDVFPTETRNAHG